LVQVSDVGIEPSLPPSPPDDDAPPPEELPDDEAPPDDDELPDEPPDDPEDEEAPEDEELLDEAGDPPLLLPHPFAPAKSKPRTDAGSRSRIVIPQSTIYPSAGTRERALTLPAAPRTQRVVTYDEATRWLEKIGGKTIVANEQKRGRGSVIVIVESAKGRTISRHVVFDDTLTGLERQRAVREAFTRACEALKLALY